MANRVPLVIDTTLNKLKELPANDNLDLSYNGISINGNVGTNGQVILSNGQTIYWGNVGNVTTDGVQILINKTINASQNVITNISNASLLNSSISINGTVTPLGGSIDTYTPYSTLSGVLTNKTINGTLNTLINIQNSSLANSSITIDGTVVSLGGTYSFTNSVSVSGVQQIFNKTIDGTQNTLTNIPISSLQYSNLNINGTSVSLGGTIRVGDVTVSGTQSLANKIIDGSVNTLRNIPNSALSNSSVSINGTQVTLGSSVTVNPSISLINPPNYANSAGTPGSIVYFNGYLYICVTGNTWVRFAKDNTFITYSG